MRTNIAVMVTGIGGGGHGEQILKALRMSPTSYEIVGCDMSPLSKGLMEVDHAYVVPPASDSAYVPRLLDICGKHHVKAVFHGSEAELVVMSRERDRFRKAGILLPINPKRVIDLCMDKWETAKFLVQNGFNCPKTVRVVSRDDLKEIEFLPAVLKPSTGTGGSFNTFLAQTRRELLLLGEYLLNYQNNFIVQQYMGRHDAEYTVGVLLSMEGQLINSIAVKRNLDASLSVRMKVRNLTGDSSLGSILAISSGISQGEIKRFPEVTSFCEKIAVRLGCRGAVNFQCRLVDKTPYVFEINPRFSGTTSLRAMVGYNEPDILIRMHVLGENPKRWFHYRDGVILRGLQESFVEIGEQELLR
ncbi:MAG: ATP-grasp domain-containing protein [Deltaproteobacteria bacterium]|nr:ATP-grasp domain-containing protein [Deltaproteobacteria bacterium]